jgi:hypothetical protein
MDDPDPRAKVLFLEKLHVLEMLAVEHLEVLEVFPEELEAVGETLQIPPKPTPRARPPHAQPLGLAEASINGPA